MSQLLSDTLLLCAEALKAECLERAGSIHMFRSKADSIGFPGPSLVSPPPAAGLHLQDLSKILYNAPEVSQGHALRVWELACETIWQPKSTNHILVSLLSEVFPSLPFPVRLWDDVRLPLLCYLLACSWHFGTLRTNSYGVVLYIDNKQRIGIDRRSVEWIGGYRLTRNEISLHPKTVFASNLGRRIKATTTTSALYRYLMSTLPDLSTQIDHIFQAAVHAGRPYEEVLSAPFDVQGLRNVEKVDSDLWTEALKIVDSSTLKPYSKLFSLLVPTVMTRTTFRRMFGERSARSETFSHTERSKYRSVIVAAQSSVITKVKEVASGEEPEQISEEAQELLELQRLLGGSL